VIAPHLFIGVPRFFEKLHAGIEQALQSKPAWQRRLAAWSLAVGYGHANATRAGLAIGIGARLRFQIAERLVLRRVRSVFGPNLRYSVSGSAPMPEWLLKRLHAIGILVLEAYGLSEDIIPIAANRPSSYRFGTVGTPMHGNEVQLAEDGELLVRGPGVLEGYVGVNGAESEPRIDERGFLATGDFATQDAEGFVSLKGRKSEVFKLSTGRRVAPAAIESAMRQITCLDHAVLLGANRARPVAIVTLAEGGPTAADGSLQTASQTPAFWEQLIQRVRDAIESFPHHLQPAGLVVVMRPFSTEGGELTPNMKVRREQIQARFGIYVDELLALVGAAPGSPVRESREEGTIALLGL